MWPVACSVPHSTGLCARARPVYLVLWRCRHCLQRTPPRSVPHLRRRQATVCICSSCWSTWGQEGGGAMRCCDQGLCVSSAKTTSRKDGSHLARYRPSSSAPHRRRSQLVSRKWHHLTVNCRTWPGCVCKRRADISGHVRRVTSSCFFQLRRLRQIRKHVSRQVMKQLVHTFVISRLDYCNSILAGLPMGLISQLQRVQNSAARLVLGLQPRGA